MKIREKLLGFFNLSPQALLIYFGIATILAISFSLFAFGIFKKAKTEDKKESGWAQPSAGDTIAKKILNTEAQVFQ